MAPNATVRGQRSNSGGGLVDLRVVSGPEGRWFARFANDRGSFVEGPTRAAALGRLVRRYPDRFPALAPLLFSGDEALGLALIEQRKPLGIKTVLVQSIDLVRSKIFLANEPVDLEWGLSPSDLDGTHDPDH